jgi:MoxR-vWA-beta-propeller ternary system domain bpX2
MANDATNNIVYYLQLPLSRKDDLAVLRAYSNLKVAYVEDFIWVKDFELFQFQDTSVQALPSKNLFYEQNSKLFPYKSNLPFSNIPSVLWTPIQRATPVTLGSENHNFFGIEEEVKLKLVESDTFRAAAGMLLTLKQLLTYVENAPEIRLKQLTWIVLDENTAFLLGSPILPIDAPVYWKKIWFRLVLILIFQLHMLPC